MRQFYSSFVLVSQILLTSLYISSCATTNGDSKQAAVAQGCHFAAQLKLVEAVPVEKRMSPSLKALAVACPQTMGDLAATAAQAATLQDRNARAQILAQAAIMALPSGCSTTNALVSAKSLQWGCPAPADMQLADALLNDLDAGTYLFVLASRARLQGAEQLDKDAQRVLKNLLLSAAIEAEVARTDTDESADTKNPKDKNTK